MSIHFGCKTSADGSLSLSLSLIHHQPLETSSFSSFVSSRLVSLAFGRFWPGAITTRSCIAIAIDDNPMISQFGVSFPILRPKDRPTDRLLIFWISSSSWSFYSTTSAPFALRWSAFIPFSLLIPSSSSSNSSSSFLLGCFCCKRSIVRSRIPPPLSRSPSVDVDVFTLLFSGIVHCTHTSSHVM